MFAPLHHSHRKRPSILILVVMIYFSWWLASYFQAEACSVRLRPVATLTERRQRGRALVPSRRHPRRLRRDGRRRLLHRRAQRSPRPRPVKLLDGRATEPLLQTSGNEEPGSSQRKRDFRVQRPLLSAVAGRQRRWNRAFPEFQRSAQSPRTAKKVVMMTSLWLTLVTVLFASPSMMTSLWWKLERGWPKDNEKL